MVDGFYVFDECLIHEFVAAWRWVTASEVPVTRMVGTSGVESLDGLEDELNRCLHPCGAKHLGHLLVDVLYAERLI